ncbi:MAG: hypothetical protein R6U46_12995 [Marinilabilia sp.]
MLELRLPSILARTANHLHWVFNAAVFGGAPVVIWVIWKRKTNGHE